MALFLVRIPLTVLFGYIFYRLVLGHPELSGGNMILLLGYGLFGGVLLAIVWAPVIGEKLSDPLTSTITQETSLPPQTNLPLRLIGYFQSRGFHRAALLFVFVEGVRHPDLPQAALLGLRSARPGSLLERCFAKEVYKFNNVQNCLYAYKVLKERHGITPSLHRHPEVNLAIMSLDRKPPPEPSKLQLKPAEAKPPPQRKTSIKLFEK